MCERTPMMKSIVPTEKNLNYEGHFWGYPNATPSTYFDGVRYGGSYAQWGTYLDNLLSVPSEFSISSTAYYTNDSIVVSYTIESSSETQDSPSVYGVVVEDVLYTGRNGIPEHKGVFRKGLTAAAGIPLQFSELGVATGRFAIPKNSNWDVSKLRAVLSVQNSENKRAVSSKSNNGSFCAYEC